MSRYFVFWFESPLQSWGHNSKFAYRDASQFPTKSGVYGLLLCSMGRGGEQQELLSKLADMRQDVFSIKKNGTDEKILEDYSVSGSGYISKGWEGLMIPRKRDGTTSSSATKIQTKVYLQDAIFAVIQEIPDMLCQEVKEGLINPCWPIYLGRKCCIPSYPVYQGDYETRDEALDRIKKICLDRKFVIRKHIYEGYFSDKGEVQCLRDVPVCFGIDKKYKSRFITIEDIEDECQID